MQALMRNAGLELLVEVPHMQDMRAPHGVWVILCLASHSTEAGEPLSRCDAHATSNRSEHCHGCYLMIGHAQHHKHRSVRRQHLPHFSEQHKQIGCIQDWPRSSFMHMLPGSVMLHTCKSAFPWVLPPCVYSLHNLGLSFATGQLQTREVCTPR